MTAKIGKNVIENLTTSMYSDQRIIYREYIQNSADSIDKAISEGLISKEEGSIDIYIKNKERNISIEDNGVGIKQEDFYRIMSSIAESTKNREEDKGFRGIGRLGGISCCDQLIFSCSAADENIESICIWDAKKIWDILEDDNQKPTAQQLVDEVTSFTEKECKTDKHFFKVELINISKNSNELLDEQNIKDFLRDVAPIRYSNGFIYKGKINKFAEENNFPIDAYNVFLNSNRLFKTYKTDLCKIQGDKLERYDSIKDVDLRLIKNDAGEVLAWMWFGISRFEKVIPKVNKMRCIRLRKDNIQIGDEKTLANQGLYKEARSDGYFVGEIFAVHPKLIPNARRDYFVINDTCREFEEKVREILSVELTKYYRTANDYKINYRKIKNAIDEENEYKNKLQKHSFIDSKDQEKEKENLSQTKKKAKAAKKKIEHLKENNQGNKVLNRVFTEIEKEYLPDQKVSTEPEETLKNTKYKKKVYKTQELTQYSKKEQKLISKIYVIIKKVLPPDLGEQLIDTIQKELKNES